MENRPLDNIRDKISEGDLEIAIELTLDWINVQSQKQSNAIFFYKLKDEIIQLSGRKRSLEHEKRLGIISVENFALRINRVRKSLVDLLSEMEERGIRLSVNEIEHRKGIRDYINNLASGSKFEYDFFICYSSFEERSAFNIWERLMGLGFRVFLSGESLKDRIGEDYGEVIENALLNSNHLIFFCTDNSLRSPWCQEEYRSFYYELHMKTKKKRRIFIYKDRDVNETIPLFMRTRQYFSNVDDLVKAVIGSNNYNRITHDENSDVHENVLPKENIKPIAVKDHGVVNNYSKTNKKANADEDSKTQMNGNKTPTKENNKGKNSKSENKINTRKRTAVKRKKATVSSKEVEQNATTLNTNKKSLNFAENSMLQSKMIRDEYIESS